MSEYQKLLRFLWCKKHENIDFEDYVFVDETTVRMLEVPLYHSRRKSDRPTAFPRSSKIRLKLNIWGGISYKGPTPFVVSKIL